MTVETIDQSTKVYHDIHDTLVWALPFQEPDTGYQSHHYRIQFGKTVVPIDFHKGAVRKGQINGISDEALIAVLIHRLHGRSEQAEFKYRPEFVRLVNHLRDAAAVLDSITLNKLLEAVNKNP